MNTFKNPLTPTYFVRLLIASLGAFTLSTVAHATPVIDVTFQDDTLGAPPSTATPIAGATIVKPSTVTSTAGLLTVANDYTSGETLNGRSVVMRVTNAEGGGAVVGGQLNILANAADFKEKADYAFKFDLLFNGSYGRKDASALRINLYNKTVGSAGMQAFLIFNNGSLTLYPGDQISPQTFNNAWAYDEVLQVEAELLYSTNQLQISINNTAIGSISLNTAKTPAGINGIQFTHAGNNSHFEVGIANIEGAVIPEPNSVALIGLVGLLLLVGKSYHKRILK